MHLTFLITLLVLTIIPCTKSKRRVLWSDKQGSFPTQICLRASLSSRNQPQRSRPMVTTAHAFLNQFTWCISPGRAWTPPQPPSLGVVYLVHIAQCSQCCLRMISTVLGHFFWAPRVLARFHASVWTNNHPILCAAIEELLLTTRKSRKQSSRKLCWGR